MTEPETHEFAGDGVFPNSPLPLLIYRAALPADAAAMERHFAEHGWRGGWRDGIYDFHHFHSNAHEVLGIARGEVRAMFGGPQGQEFTLHAGDVVVIPAGVAHRNMGDAGDLLVVGAYPGAAAFDTRRGDPAEYAEVLRNVSSVKLPDSDPVDGEAGALRRIWA
ncbi:MAG: cupin domain-containing protein [Rhodospirillales bacterium]|nr:cupin domain-containing protein [Rhodospirillales bacterium]